MLGEGDTSRLIWVGPSKVVVDLLMAGRELVADLESLTGDSDITREDTERVDLILGLCSGSGDGGGDGSSGSMYR